MLKVKFFHLPKPKQFKYTPRYFDPEKEELEKRKADFQKQKGEGAIGSNIQGAFSQRLLTKRKAQQSSNLRLLIIIAILIILAWWLLH